MHSPVSLKSAERKAFQSTFADGLWDVFIGFFALEFAIAPLLSKSLGDFWSSAIFLPVFGVVYLFIRLIRKYVVAPRIGTVSFGNIRRQKLQRFSLIMLIANIVIFILGIIVALNFRRLPGFGIAGLLSLFLLAVFSFAAYGLDYARLYLYGLMFFIAPLIGEWLYANHGASHHGYPIV
ncbi:MAG TPA: hypothetical protein VIS72_06625, partial [Anaerolineales bacterium]